MSRRDLGSRGVRRGMAVGLVSISSVLVLALAVVLPERSSASAAPDRAVGTDSNPVTLPLAEDTTDPGGTDHDAPFALGSGAGLARRFARAPRSSPALRPAPPKGPVLGFAPKTSPPR